MVGSLALMGQLMWNYGRSKMEGYLVNCGPYLWEGSAVQRLYREAEQLARAERVGLWRDVEPVPPWEWRSTQRSR